MIEQSITICGFPESGKTTYLAALWHLVTARVEETALKFDSLRDGNSAHLNALATRWRDGLTQIRTEIPAQKLVSMNLRDCSDAVLRLTFPDLSGESYKVMFEDRECAPMVAEILGRGKGVLFFVHADKIRQPHLVVDMMAQSAALGSPITPGQEVKCSRSLAPTQIRIVEFAPSTRLPTRVSRQRGFSRKGFLCSTSICGRGRTSGSRGCMASAPRGATMKKKTRRCRSFSLRNFGPCAPWTSPRSASESLAPGQRHAT